MCRCSADVSRPPRSTPPPGETLQNYAHTCYSCRCAGAQERGVRFTRRTQSARERRRVLRALPTGGGAVTGRLSVERLTAVTDRSATGISERRPCGPPRLLPRPWPLPTTLRPWSVPGWVVKTYVRDRPFICKGLVPGLILVWCLFGSRWQALSNGPPVEMTALLVVYTKGEGVGAATRGEGIRAATRGRG